MPIVNTVVGGGGGAGSTALAFDIELISTGWIDDDEELTVSYQEVSNDNFIIDNYSYFVSPYQDNYQEYIDASIRAFDINTEGKILFCCLKENKPTNNITVNVLRMEETYDE